MGFLGDLAGAFIDAAIDGFKEGYKESKGNFNGIVFRCTDMTTCTEPFIKNAMVQDILTFSGQLCGIKVNGGNMNKFWFPYIDDVEELGMEGPWQAFVFTIGKTTVKFGICGNYQYYGIKAEGLNSKEILLQLKNYLENNEFEHLHISEVQLCSAEIPFQQSAWMDQVAEQLENNIGNILNNLDYEDESDDEEEDEIKLLQGDWETGEMLSKKLDEVFQRDIKEIFNINSLKLQMDTSNPGSPITFTDGTVEIQVNCGTTFMDDQCGNVFFKYTKQQKTLFLGFLEVEEGSRLCVQFVKPDGKEISFEVLAPEEDLTLDGMVDTLVDDYTLEIPDGFVDHIVEFFRDLIEYGKKIHSDNTKSELNLGLDDM